MIYLDNIASTPINDKVLEEMVYWLKHPANPGNRTHRMGLEAHDAIERARSQVAALVGTQAESVIFTSGATEGCNWVADWFSRFEKGSVLLPKTEHKSTLKPVLHRLPSERVETMEVALNGDVLGLEDAIAKHDAPLVCLSHGNNENGFVHDLKYWSDRTHAVNGFFFADCSQSAARLELDVDTMGVDFAVLGAHKMYGPKGMGALVVHSERIRARLKPMIYGGTQQLGLRAGTMNVAGIVGMGAAAQFLIGEKVTCRDRLIELSTFFQKEMNQAIPNVVWVGIQEGRLPGHWVFRIPGVSGAELLSKLSENLCLSLGSACTQYDEDANHVSRAMGLDAAQARESVRVGIGTQNTREELVEAIRLIKEASGV